MVALLALEDRVLARLHMLGQALGSSSVVVLKTTNADVIVASRSFDLLQDSTSEKVTPEHSRYFREHLSTSLAGSSTPLSILSLPAHPRQQP
ncbi:hypothetical protein BJV74DRAFT_887365 [Russula compacta]|nr:hypothetical protein BJV74DRAFT_887365 [Russula compacta]